MINSNFQNNNNLFIHNTHITPIKERTYLSWKESKENSNRNSTHEFYNSQEFNYSSVLSSSRKPQSYARILGNHTMIEAEDSGNFHKKDNET
jgi:hypothetical protein